MDETKLKSIIESALFVKGEPIKISQLAKIVRVKKSEIIESVQKLVRKYKQNDSGLIIIKKNDKVQLATKPENAKYINQIIKKDLQNSLSRTALEVLAIIAYRSPISRLDIEAIRGVNSSFTLRNLLMRGLIIRETNSKDQRGYLYEISFEFLKKMGITSIKKLPNYEKLSRDGRVESIINIHSKK